MKYALILNHFAKSPQQPGGNRHIDLFTRLEGWRVKIVAADRSYMSNTRQSSVAGLPITYVRTVSGRGAVARIAGWVSYALGAFFVGLRAPRPDVVYASSPHLFAGLAGYAIARRWRIPWVLEVRDVWPRILVEMGGISPRSPAYRVLRRVERFLYARADHVVHLAAGIRPYLIEEGVAPSQLSFVPNSVSLTAPSITRDEARSKYNLDGVVAAYTGVHGEANHLELLLGAAETLGEEFPELTVVLLGDGPVKSRLVAEVAHHNIQNVQFRDAIPKRDLPEFYVGVDIGLHVLRDVPLFRHGVSPNKVMDYLAAGLPVVTNSPGEVGNLIHEPKAGIITEPDRITEGIRELLTHTPEERVAVGRNGQEFTQAQRNPDLMARRLQRVLNQHTQG